MLRSLQSLRGYALRAVDGEVGRVTEFYFDDEHWVVRYIVVNTGGWFGPEVLVAPQSFRRADWAGRVIDVALTRDQVRNSPSVDLHKPVSRQYEANYYAYFGYAPYWGGPGTWAAAAPSAGAMPDPILASQRAVAAADHAERTRATPGRPDTSDARDSRLRSMNEVSGYHIQASDGEVGHVDDFIADDMTWEIRYIEIDTSNWIGGRAVLVPRWGRRGLAQSAGARRADTRSDQEQPGVPSRADRGGRTAIERTLRRGTWMG